MIENISLARAQAMSHERRTPARPAHTAATTRVRGPTLPRPPSALERLRTLLARRLARRARAAAAPGLRKGCC